MVEFSDWYQIVNCSSDRSEGNLCCEPISCSCVRNKSNLCSFTYATRTMSARFNLHDCSVNLQHNHHCHFETCELS